jgi:hypothetical protein
LAAKLIPFPCKTGYPRDELEGLLRSWLSELSGNQELIDAVTSRMIKFVDTYANVWFEPVFDLPVPAGLTQQQADAMRAAIQKGVDETAMQVQNMVNKIIVERFFLEIDRYESQYDAKRHVTYHGKLQR